MGWYLAIERREVLPSKPCKAVIEVMSINHLSLSVVIFGSELMPLNG